MHPTLKKAFDKANAVVLEMTGGDAALTAERDRLTKLTTEELIEELLALKFKKSKDVKVVDLAYAIMCTPECAALSYDMIASVILKHRPGKTNANNISWYASKALEKGYDTVPRISQKELNKLILASAA